ncbi:hypothetical protein ACH5RR_041803 [Cinchona calisaya]|uniref:Late blight resistance protein R1A-like N-terminal domain-containing protein n=1 Tax=Cinchona calisaya TaxID=153742 RepID=A0ABD2XUK2_9GENT
MSDRYIDTGVELLDSMSVQCRQFGLYLTELKRLRTFLKCTLGWSEYLLLKKSDDDDDDDDEVAAVSLRSLLGKIKDALFILIRDFGSISQLENTSFVLGDTDCCFVLCGEVQKILSRYKPTTGYQPMYSLDQLKIYDILSRFDENSKVLGQEINRAYITFSDCLSKLTSPMRDVNELMELIDTVLENLTGILNCCDANFHVRFTVGAFHVRLQNLIVKLRSLKSFICFAKFRDVEHGQLQNLLIHAEIFTLKAAHFLYMFWDCVMYEMAQRSEAEVDEDDIQIKSHEMLQKIMFVDPFAPEIHIRALQALKASGSTHSLEMKNKEIERDFVDSLSATLWIVLANSGCIAEYFDDGEKSSDDLVQNQLTYKCILNSKATEESMANFARWEPSHGSSTSSIQENSTLKSVHPFVTVHTILQH